MLSNHFIYYSLYEVADKNVYMAAPKAVYS